MKLLARIGGSQPRYLRLDKYLPKSSGVRVVSGLLSLGLRFVDPLPFAPEPLTQPKRESGMSPCSIGKGLGMHRLIWLIAVCLALFGASELKAYDPPSANRHAVSCICAEPGAGQPARTPLLADELRALRVLKREAKSPFIFVSERGAPFSVSGLAKLIERAGVEAKIPFPVHAHMLRHACSYALANKGTDTRTLQAYLGHRSIQSTVRYTELAPGRFKNLWRS